MKRKISRERPGYQLPREALRTRKVRMQGEPVVASQPPRTGLLAAIHIFEDRARLIHGKYEFSATPLFFCDRRESGYPPCGTCGVGSDQEAQ